MRTGDFLAGTTPYSSNMRRTRSLPLSNSVEPCLLESHMISATDAFPDTTPADQRHTQTAIGDHFSDIDEDEQGDDATSQPLDEGVGDEAQPLAGGASVTRGTCDDTDAHMTPDVADLVADTDDALSTTEPPRDSHAGSHSSPCLLVAPPHVLGRSTRMAAPAATHVAAPLLLEVARDPDDDETTTIAPATDTGVVIDTDPNPVTTDILADEHISLFLRHARRRAEDAVAGLVMDAAPPDTNTGVVVDLAPGVAAPVVAVGPTNDVDVGTADGALPGVADFGPTPDGRDRDEVTAVAPDGVDFEPTSLDSAWARGSDATAAMPTDTGRVVDGVSDRGYGTDTFADEVLFADVAGFDLALAGSGGDEVTAATLADVPTRKRKHMTATRADDAGGSATATADLNPNLAWGGW